MLTSPSAVRSNPCVMAGLIARTSLKLIDERERRTERSTSQVFEATLLRLLEIYQYDAFRNGKHKSILARSSSLRSELRTGRDLAKEVGEAMAAAHKSIFPGMGRSEFCRLMASDVKACFSGSPDVTDLAERKVRLRRFLRLFEANLLK